jgi:antitoxin VapB
MEAKMAFHIRDAETNNAVRKLAAITGLTLTEAVRTATAEKLQRLMAEQTEADRGKTLDQIVDEIRADLDRFGRSGKKADKAFYDDLSGGL